MPTTSTRSATLTLPTDEQIMITREFGAPRRLVWRAWTEPDLVRRWWHAKRGDVTVCEIDLRVGGAWRYVMVTPDGMEVGFHGEFRAIVPDERLVSTEVFEGLPDGDSDPALNTLSLEEAGGRTLATLLVETPTKEQRDAIVESGMEDGLQDALDLVEEVAQSLR